MLPSLPVMEWLMSTLLAPRTSPVNRNPDDHIIRATGVVKTYNGGSGTAVRALRGVDLVVPRGEMLAIMGPSGCGKTTLLNCLSGIDTLDGGQVLIDGTDINSLSDRQKSRYRAQRMGFIFQTYNLLPVLSAAENVELPLVVSGVNAREARAKAMAALDRVGLADRARHWPGQLSGGQRQRVTIARALVNEPAIVWADEPTGNLDSEMADDVMRLMETLNTENGQTFVIVTHDPAIGDRCHRIVRMRDGMIVGEEHPR
ncbi:MAG: ABC transporter ATP-binding protein [Dehalococcoidia bacterium]